ncbi:hypothetical protein PF002_g27923, partial [Phytophthora fragariae]
MSTEVEPSQGRPPGGAVEPHDPGNPNSGRLEEEGSRVEALTQDSIVAETQQSQETEEKEFLQEETDDNT